MAAYLLDVNVLVALFDPAHPNHRDAHRWFASHRQLGWASCPVTLHGCIRVLSNPAYPTVQARPEEVMDHLRVLCSRPDHEFWRESVSLLDDRLFRGRMIEGHNKITDVYLLGLALRHKSRLATFDRSIPLKAVVGAEPQHVELLG